MKKYSIEDFIEKKLIAITNVAKVKKIASALEKYDIDVHCVDSIEARVNSPTINLYVEDDLLILIEDNALTDYIVELGRSSLVSSYEINWEVEIDEENKNNFKLKQIVHAVIRANEPFNPFARDQHVTAFITSIDEDLEMAEICYLHQKHNAVWVSFEDIHEIKHTYSEDDLYAD